jgi:hypothetical protein
LTKNRQSIVGKITDRIKRLTANIGIAATLFKSTFKYEHLKSKIMKRILFLVCLLTTYQFILGQTTNESQKIVEKILAITEKYNKTWETLNMEMVAKFHSDSSFRYYSNIEVGHKQ